MSIKSILNFIRTQQNFGQFSTPRSLVTGYSILLNEEKATQLPTTTLGSKLSKYLTSNYNNDAFTMATKNIVPHTHIYVHKFSVTATLAS